MSNRMGELLKGSLAVCIAEQDCARVDVKFETLEQAQRFYMALVDCHMEEKAHRGEDPYALRDREGDHFN